MLKINAIFSLIAFACLFQISQLNADVYDSDTIGTVTDQLVITFIGHGTLMFQYGGKVVHIDPTLRESDYENLPSADLILITHEHGDHLDPSAIEKIRQTDTEIVLNKTSELTIGNTITMVNGETRIIKGFKIEAVPAYNLINKRDNGKPYHPVGNGNGYVISFGERRVYIAGDTEYIPEMNDMGKIDIAFLPMNLPYTMTVEMAAKAVDSIKPAIFYPYHFGDSEVNKLETLIEKNNRIEIRIRDMQ